jgi:hypothetical protein
MKGPNFSTTDVIEFLKSSLAGNTPMVVMDSWFLSKRIQGPVGLYEVPILGSSEYTKVLIPVKLLEEENQENQFLESTLASRIQNRSSKPSWRQTLECDDQCLSAQ